MAITTFIAMPYEHDDLATAREDILAAAKKAAEAGKHGRVEIVLPDGKHTLKAPFRLSVEEYPELASIDVTLRAQNQGRAEVNSLVRMDGTKFDRPEGKGYFTYDFKEKEGTHPLFRDFFLNFKKIPMSTSRVFRNLDPLTDAERDGTEMREGLWAPVDICEKIVEGPIGATEIVMYIEWNFAILHVAEIDLSKTREEGGVTYALVRFKEGEMETFAKRLGRHLNIGNREMFFTNCPALMTTNTFAYDYHTGVLYLDAENPEYMWCHALEYPATDVLFEFDGLENVKIDGVVFSGTTSTHVCKNMYLSGQANTISGLEEKNVRRLWNAAVLARNTRGMTVTNCTFRNLGTNGVQAVDRSVLLTVKDNQFYDVAMCAVTVGNPTSDWDTPKNRTFRLLIENNYFNHIAYGYPSSPCIYVAQVDGVKLLHNTVEDCAYSAVSIGWVWRPANYELGERVNIRGAELAYNYFRNYMQLLKDGGAIYVLGGNANRYTTPERFNKMHDNFAIIDKRENVYGKYGYYCDGAASNWDVYHSVVLNDERMPIFSQPHPQALSFHNHFTDIWSNTTAHPSTDQVQRDIVRTNYVYDDLPADAYLEKYPEARAIRDAAGCNLPL